MKVVQFNRKRSEAGSIEILFSIIRKYMSASVDVELFIPRYESNGFFKRIYIVLESAFNQGDINHITGDINFIAILLQKKKTILTVHDCGHVLAAKGLKRAILKFFWFTLPLKRVQYVTVISEKTKEELLSLVNFDEERIFVIPDCISDKFTFVEKENFNEQKPRILQVGTKVNKNLIRLCEALNGISCILDIVGRLSSDQYNALKKNNIEYVNSFNIGEDELIKKYIDADIVAFVSTHEGFGMPILEAQTVGRVLLTSNISPLSDVAGTGAQLIDPYSVEDIRTGIVNILSDDLLRTKIINKGRENAKKYNPHNIAKMYTDLYRNV